MTVPRDRPAFPSRDPATTRTYGRTNVRTRTLTPERMILCTRACRRPVRNLWERRPLDLGARPPYDPRMATPDTPAEPQDPNELNPRGQPDDEPDGVRTTRTETVEPADRTGDRESDAD